MQSNSERQALLRRWKVPFVPAAANKPACIAQNQIVRYDPGSNVHSAKSRSRKCRDARSSATGKRPVQKARIPPVPVATSALPDCWFLDPLRAELRVR
eukprot:748815-Pleurochrysis_carterae.AAC.1